jgi:hypothetical protein
LSLWIIVYSLCRSEWNEEYKRTYSLRLRSERQSSKDSERQSSKDSERQSSKDSERQSSKDSERQSSKDF